MSVRVGDTYLPSSPVAFPPIISLPSTTVVSYRNNPYNTTTTKIFSSGPVADETVADDTCNSNMTCDRAREIGRKLYVQQKYREADEVYAEAIAHPASSDTQRSLLHSNRALCFAQLGLWDESSAQATEAIKADSTVAKGYYRLAVAIQNDRSKPLGLAIKALETCLSLDPSADASELLTELRGIANAYPTHDTAVNGSNYNVAKTSSDKHYPSTNCPRFLRFLGMEAPKTQDICPDRKCTDLPLHAKPVDGSIDIDALVSLALKHNATPLISALSWLCDGSLYSKLPLHLVQRKDRCALSVPDLEILLQLDRYEFAAADTTENALMFCRAFTVPEISKNRRRHILEPLINDIITGSGEIQLPTRSEIRKGLKKYTILLDAASFYDQFRLGPEVRRFFAVRSRWLGTLVYKNLPMGFKKSCTIAQRTAELMLDFVNPTGGPVYKVAYIDNFLFSADNKEDLLAAVKEFRSRCDSVGLVLNEPDGDDTSLITQKFEFLGVWYDCSSENEQEWQSANTEKTLAKLELVLTTLTKNNLTWRQQAAIFGILFFAESVAPLRGAGLANYFDALAHLRQKLTNVSNWDAPAVPFSPLASVQLREWCKRACENECLFFKKKSCLPTCEIYVDASSTGWGCIATTERGTSHYAGKWSNHDHEMFNLHSSVAAEPLALRRAVLAVTSTLHPKTAIRAFVDHQGLFWAFHRGHSRVHAYNECIRYVHTICQCPIEVHFVAGINNCADALSRRIWAAPTTYFEHHEQGKEKKA